MPKRPLKKPWNARPDLFAPAPPMKPIEFRPGPTGLTTGHLMPAAWRVVEVRGADRVPLLLGGREWRGNETQARNEAARLRRETGGDYEAEPSA